MKKLVILGLGLLLTLNPLKVNANQEYEEWQLELLERATYKIHPLYKNELQEIDGDYYLYEEVDVFIVNGYENGWEMSSSNYFRNYNIDVPIEVLNFNGNNYHVRTDIASDRYLVGSYMGIVIVDPNPLNDLLFTVNIGYPSGTTNMVFIRDIQHTDLPTFIDYLNNNPLVIYYKLDESRLTLLDWYDPTPTPTPDETGYTYLLIPSLLIVGVLAGYIYYKRKEKTI